MARQNVRQHVVPQFYLEHFTDANGHVHVIKTASGEVFNSNPTNLCVEKDVYTLLRQGQRDDSYDKVNNIVEGKVAPVLQSLSPRVALTDEATCREMFTVLLVFTGNLVARSRVSRNHLNNSLSIINSLLEKESEFIDSLPNADYEAFLKNPAAFPEVVRACPALEKLAPLLLEYNEKSQDKDTTVAGTVTALEDLRRIHYPALLGPRLGCFVEGAITAKVKGDLLVTTSRRFISGDDPVVFMTDDHRAPAGTSISVQTWSDAKRSVFLPLNPRMAVLWSHTGEFTIREVDDERVQQFNCLVRENAIAQVFAADPADFTNAQ